ncbi:MAG: DMT family transporter [Gammaproteobacteria bacterium]|jgi:drug/metabolite transporter (DMT)-like permease
MNAALVYPLVALSTLFWGANFVLAGPVLADIPPLWAAALRFALGTAVMLAVAIWRGEELIAPLRRHAKVYALLGAVGIGGFNLLFFFALQTTSAANGALIMATNPLLTTVLAALLLGETSTRRQRLALPLAFVGVVVVISGGDLHHLAELQLARGDLLMIGADVTWAFYNILTRRYLPSGSAVTNTTLVMAAGMLLLLVVALGSGEIVHVPSFKAGGSLVTMAVGGTVLAYLFWNMGIVHLGAARTALFLNLVPVFAMSIGALLGTAPSEAQTVGGLLVISAVSIAMLPSRRLAVS